MGCPDLYKKIDIIPDSVVEVKKEHKQKRAISAFSGGVDATFTALRHTEILPEKLRYPLDSVLMVHGFDVDLYNYDGFDKLKKRISPVLEGLSLNLRTVRTNSRDLRIQDWNFSHGLELAACLHMYDEFDFALIGSSDPYTCIMFPHGSTPLSDHLMSGDGLRIVHDGSAFTRIDKVRTIMQFPTACSSLKFCWAGVDQSGNCGRCEKCVRTRLNFIVAGAKETPSCFPNDLNVNYVNNLVITSEGQYVDLVEIANYARDNNISGEWVEPLNGVLNDWSPPAEWQMYKKNYGGFAKRTVAKTIIKIGLGEFAKKIWRKLRRVALKGY